MNAGETLRVLLVQARLAWKQTQRNREHLEALVDGCGQEFDLALFPETFTTGFLGDPDLPAEDMSGPTVTWMRGLAARYRAAFAGSAVICENGLRYNRFLLASPEGESGRPGHALDSTRASRRAGTTEEGAFSSVIPANAQHSRGIQIRWYDKRHLFSYGGENRRYTSGRERHIFPLGDWRISPQVCYDLRFPVWCRNRGDFDLQVFVANWPAKRVQHWTALLRARAIENQSWVVGLNRAGADGNGIVYPGCSQVYDPLGELACGLGDVEECRAVTLDLGRVRETRATFPFQEDADPFDLQSS